MGGHHGNKAAARKAFRIKLLSLLRPITHTQSPCGSHQNGPRADQSDGGPIPWPTPSHRAKEKGQLEETRKIKQNAETQGFQSEIWLAVRTCYFFCGGAQKSSVIIANDVFWWPQSLRSKLSFQRNRNQSLHFFLSCSYLFLFFSLFI